MPMSPNLYRVQRKPVRTPIIRLHGAPTFIPSKRQQAPTCDKYLVIPNTVIDSPPPNRRRRSLSLPSANRNRPRSRSPSPYLTPTDVRKSARRKSEKERVSNASNYRNISANRVTVEERMKDMKLEDVKQVKKARIQDFDYDKNQKKSSTGEIRRSKSDQNIHIMNDENMFEEKDTANSPKIFNYDFDSISVSSDDFSLEAYPPSLSTDSIEISPILITRPI